MVKMDFHNLIVDVEINTLDGVVVMEISNNQINVKVTFDPEDFVHMVNSLNQVVVELEGEHG